MIQNKLINTFKETFIEDYTIKAAIIYGSFARKCGNINSDIDLVILNNNNFNINEFENSLQQAYNIYNILDIVYVSLRNKIVVYFKELPKIEITFIKDINEIERNYKGSLIPLKYIEESILFGKTEALLNSLKKWTKKNASEDISVVINDLVAKFIYDFESCSSLHSRSDGYKFYYFYNIAFHIAVQLKYLAKGDFDNYYLPKNILVNNITEKDAQNKFYETSGSVYLRDANKKKRNLLNLFYQSLSELKYSNSEKVKSVLERIYKRDYLWNFRDIAKFNTNAKDKIIYRTSTLSSFQKEKCVLPYLKEKGITTIIDIRANHEIAKNSYNDEFISNFKYIKADLDPWSQPEWFKNENHSDLTNSEIAYHFFVKACKPQIKIIFNAILKAKRAVAIHCLAGKDRTGLIIMLVGMLTDASYQDMLNDYLSSEIDAHEKKFKIYYNLVVEQGGVTSYLKSCNISDVQIKGLINKIKI